ASCRLASARSVGLDAGLREGNGGRCRVRPGRGDGVQALGDAVAPRSSSSALQPVGAAAVLLRESSAGRRHRGYEGASSPWRLGNAPRFLEHGVLSPLQCGRYKRSTCGAR
ncbi:unnamed protein product, partial [Ectocarpus sp. 12 AP-2014]